MIKDLRLNPNQIYLTITNSQIKNTIIHVISYNNSIHNLTSNVDLTRSEEPHNKLNPSKGKKTSDPLAIHLGSHGSNSTYINNLNIFSNVGKEKAGWNYEILFDGEFNFSPKDQYEYNFFRMSSYFTTYYFGNNTYHSVEGFEKRFLEFENTITEIEEDSIQEAKNAN